MHVCKSLEILDKGNSYRSSNFQVMRYFVVVFLLQLLNLKFKREKKSFITWICFWESYKAIQ